MTPKSGSADDIASALIGFINSKECNVLVVGCDGTVVNTGYKNGIIAKIEQHFGRCVQWSVCMLHRNELPLRKLITQLDGKSTGPKGFSGPIGKLLNNCEGLPILDFAQIPGENIHVSNMDDLSTDQKYLLSIYRAISSGEVSDSLALLKPGNIVLSRWLTTANRLLRLYVSTSSPSENFKMIVLFIMKVYVPTWLEIKCNQSIVLGSKHLYSLIKRMKSLGNDLVDIVKATVQRNAFFANPETILLCMTHDENPWIRKLTWRRILKARKLHAEHGGVRAFMIPKLNFDADNYYDMVTWMEDVTEPPLTSFMDTAEIEKFIDWSPSKHCGLE